MLEEPVFRKTLTTRGGGDLIMSLINLNTGSLYDVYCFVTEVQEKVPFGAVAPPVAMMSPEAYPCLSLDDRVCRMMGIFGFPWKIHILFINGPHMQYIQVDIIFSYICHF